MFDRRPKQVIFYPTYAYQKNDAWLMPLRLRVTRARPLIEKNLPRLVHLLRRMTTAETENFCARILDFIADSESRQLVQFKFDADAAQTIFQLLAADEKILPTNLNGFCTGEIALPQASVAVWQTASQAQKHWLSFCASSKNHRGTGRVQLLPPHGLSIISDIDDTIKITNILAGKRTLLRNTFLQDFKAVPNMAEKYRAFQDAAFHYVSGSPWQLQGVLEKFLVQQAGFPAGSWHMRELTKNPASLATWRHWKNFFTDENATYTQKIQQISQIMQHFPHRKFILIGDSGERDREIYEKIATTYGEQIEAIFIRDVINETLEKIQ